MRQHSTVLSMTAFVLMLVACPLSSHAIDRALLAKLDPGANAIVAIDATALKKSELAIKHNWAAREFAKNPGREMSIPPESKEILISSRLETSQNLNVIWQVALLSADVSIPMQKIANAESGYIDWIGSTQVVWAPSDLYFVELNRNTLGVVYPADRQMTARWLKESRNSTPSMVSKYLQQAVEKVNEDTQIVMALDLEDVVQPHLLKRKLETTQFVNDNQTRADWYDVFASLKGLTLELNVKDKVTGMIRVDFGLSPKVLSPHHKTLLLMALSEYGAELPDMEQWDYRLSGDSIIGAGEISLSGLRRLMSLIELPSTKYDDLGYESANNNPQASDNQTQSQVQSFVPESAVSQEEIQLQATKAYFEGITTLLDDLKNTIDHTRDNHALWFERYARKIDQLPILNVDNDLLNYGANITVTFRELALAKRSAGIDGGVAKSKIYSNYSYADGSSTSGRNTSSIDFQIDRQQQSAVNKMRYDSWNQIETDTAAMRRMLTMRYGVEF